MAEVTEIPKKEVVSEPLKREVKVSHEDIEEAKRELAGLPFEEITRKYAELAAANAVLEEETKTITKKYQELEKVSGKDDLTGLLNRDGFIAEFKKYKRMQDRERYDAGSGEEVENKFTGYTLLWVDMVGLKKYNDTLGIREGDRKLTQVSDALRASAQKPRDLVARFGGDDFLIALFNTNAEDSTNVVKKIQEVLPTGLQLSIGVAQFPTETQIDDALYIAGDAMETAKELGKKDENTRSLGVGIFTIDTARLPA